MIIAILIGYIIGFTSIYFFGEYGWAVFVAVPFFLGFVPTAIIGLRENIPINRSLKIGFTALGAFCLTTLVLAVEGIICIIMASPLMAVSTMVGALVGNWLIKRNRQRSQKLYSIILLPILLLAMDLSTNSSSHLEVKTSIEIAAPVGNVWANVVSFGEIAEQPTGWLFKTGIAYPTHATIDGRGVGAVRYCHFTTGSFVEPITIWDKPNRLAFRVEDQPTPMRELNPFWDVHPPHLDGYFQSKKGEFRLSATPHGTTILEGTTWYNIHIHPVQYWDVWSKFILHKIHYRVLEHIKTSSEENLKG